MASKATVQKAVDNAKAKLRTQYKRRGLYENFGQKEVRSLRDQFGYDYSSERATKPIDEFEDWCENFTGVE